MVSPEHVKTKNKKTDPKKDEPDLKNLMYMIGYRDIDGFPIEDDDYYAKLGSLGFYDLNKLPPPGKPLTHSTDTTTALHYYDTSLKKTPINTRSDTVNPHLGKMAEYAKTGELYKIKDFGEANDERIKEKTHRILSDPSRGYQAESLIHMRDRKEHILKKFNKMPPLNQLIEYTSMVLNVNTLLLERITDILDFEEKLYEFHKKEMRPLGRNFYVEMTLTAGADATHIDFRDESKNRNVPSGVSFSDFPNHNLLSLTIVITSGAGSVHFATNKPNNSLETTVKYVSADGSYELKPGYFSIETLNIRAETANMGVKLVGLY